MGFQEIILLGHDHNMIAAYFGKTDSIHCYSANDSVLMKDLSKDQTAINSGIYTCEKTIMATARLWEHHRLISYYAQKVGVNIINATENSLLDIYPKQDLNGILSTSKS
jgi:uncharacterized SAM-dependent methyltransferase